MHIKKLGFDVILTISCMLEVNSEGMRMVLDGYHTAIEGEGSSWAWLNGVEWYDVNSGQDGSVVRTISREKNFPHLEDSQLTEEGKYSVKCKMLWQEDGAWSGEFDVLGIDNVV